MGGDSWYSEDSEKRVVAPSCPRGQHTVVWRQAWCIRRGQSVDPRLYFEERAL